MKRIPALKDLISDEMLACSFHEIYESLAPKFGYETNPNTRKFNADSPNGRLMIAVCDKILDKLQSLLDSNCRNKQYQAEDTDDN